jgi:hypothetical protein
MAGTWTIMAPIPNISASGYTNLLGACRGDDKLWAILARTNVDPDQLHLYSYDPDTDVWTEAPSTVSGAITVTGLTTDGGHLRQVGRELHHYNYNYHKAYNLDTDTWTTLAQPPEPFAYAGGWALTDDKMAYFGGYVNSSYFRGHVSTYTRSTDSWHNGGPGWLPLGSAYNHHFVGRIGDKMYSRRGHSGVDGYTEMWEIDVPTVLAFGHPASVQCDDLGATGPGPSPYLRWTGGCSDGERMWACGGHFWAGSSADDQLYYWKPGDADWTDTVSTHPQSQGTHSLYMARLGAYIWTMGGGFDTRFRERSLCRYEPAFALPSEATTRAGWGVLAS